MWLHEIPQMFCANIWRNPNCAAIRKKSNAWILEIWIAL